MINNTPLTYALLVNGPIYGTQQAYLAYQFAQAVMKKGHILKAIFFYQEGISNANDYASPASDEFDLCSAWQQLAEQYDIDLHVCVSAALRRGVVDNAVFSNLASYFQLSGLGEFTLLTQSCERIIQF